MQKIDGERIQVILPYDQLARVDRIAARTKQTRAETMRNMIEVGMTVFEDYERIGLVRMVEILERTKKALRSEVGQQTLFKA